MDEPEIPVPLSLKDIHRLTLSLANDPNRPTLTQGSQVEVQEYLDLQAKLQIFRKRLGG